MASGFTPPDPLNRNANPKTLSIYITELQVCVNILRDVLGQSAINIFISQFPGQVMSLNAIEQLKTLTNQLALDFGFSGGIENPELLGRDWIAILQLKGEFVTSFPIINDLRRVLSLLNDAGGFNMFATVPNIHPFKNFRISEFPSLVLQPQAFPFLTNSLSIIIGENLNLDIRLIFAVDTGITLNTISNIDLPANSAGTGGFPRRILDPQIAASSFGGDNDFLYGIKDAKLLKIDRKILENFLLVGSITDGGKSFVNIGGFALRDKDIVRTGHYSEPGDGFVGIEQIAFFQLISKNGVSGVFNDMLADSCIDSDLSPFTNSADPIPDGRLLIDGVRNHRAAVSAPFIDPANGDFLCFMHETLDGISAQDFGNGSTTHISGIPPVITPSNHNKQFYIASAIDGNGDDFNDDWSTHIGEVATADYDFAGVGANSGWLFLNTERAVWCSKTAIYRNGSKVFVTADGRDIETGENLSNVVYALDSLTPPSASSISAGGAIIKNGKIYGFNGAGTVPGAKFSVAAGSIDFFSVLNTSGSFLLLDELPKEVSSEAIVDGDPCLNNVDFGQIQTGDLTDLSSLDLWKNQRDGDEDIPLPESPTLLSAVRSNSGTQVTLTWTAVPGAIEYEVWYQEDGGVLSQANRYQPNIKHPVTTIATNIVVTGLPATESLFFSIVVRTANGQSQWSNSVRASRNIIGPVLSAIFGSTIDLTWTAVPGASSYFVEFTNILRDVSLSAPVARHLINVGNVLLTSIGSLDAQNIYDVRVYASMSGTDAGATSQDSNVERGCGT